jgi:hypothetical protein
MMIMSSLFSFAHWFKGVDGQDQGKSQDLQLELNQLSGKKGNEVDDVKSRSVAAGELESGGVCGWEETGDEGEGKAARAGNSGRC